MKLKSLKKRIAIFLAIFFTLTVFAGCSDSSQPSKTSSNGARALKVGICAGPYGDMFDEAIRPSLEKLGYTVELIEFSDYVQPNNALAEKEIDLNMFQHSIYLKKFCEQHNLDLTYVTEIPTASMGVFSNRFGSIEEIPSGATVAIPNDDTNLSRAFRVLAQTGIIKLNPDVAPATVTAKDIIENPKNLKFKEVSAEILPSVLDSVEVAVINGNYAIGAGLKLSDAIHNEQLAEGYYNVIAVRTEDAESQFVKDIVSIVHSDTFRSVIEDPNKQYVAFGRPSGYYD
jgi:D-methionine transport system substrate-binding protein